LTRTDKYFQTLGLRPGASKAAIKKAFRQKAKELHPDVNPSPDARDRFIAADEAYDYLIDNFERIHTQKRKSKSKKQSTYKTQHAWDPNSRERSRERAKQYANMDFDEFMRTDQFKSADKPQGFSDYLSLALMVLVVVVIPVLATIFNGIRGLIFSIFIAFATVPIWSKAVTKREIYSFDRLVVTAKYVFESRFVVQVIVIGTNIFLALWLWLVTALDPWTYLIPYEIAVIAGIVLYYFVLKDKKQYLRGLLMQSLPITLASLFFVANYAFSSEEQVETYRYIQRFEGSRSTSFIYLENNNYEETPGLRFFLIEGEMRNHNHIAMRMEMGLFDIPVLKNYWFYSK